MQETIEKYFLGELSGKEKKELLDKIETDEKFKSEFFRMQHTVTLSKLYPQKDDEAFAMRMIHELDEKVQQRKNRRMIFSIAKYAAVAALLILNAWFILYSSKTQEEEITFTSIEVPKGQRVSLTLPDGSQAWLSPLSVLRISNRYNGSERLVELNGEGYFIVSEDENKPFIVRTDQHDVKVLGTRFNVFAYSICPRFETDLLDGRVEVYPIHQSENGVVLHPGEKVSLENNHLVKSVSYFNNENYLKNGIFSFSNKPFGEILEYLSLWYDVEFDIKDSAKKELLISGKFRQSDEVKNILKALQGVHSFKFSEINDQRINIY